jgi:hypothetical protein
MKDTYNTVIMCHLQSCKKIFNAKLALQYHFRLVHLKQKSPGWCSVCNKRFTSYKSWRNHERHHKIDRFICDVCGRR